MLNLPVAIHLEQMDREAFFQTALPFLTDSSFLRALESHRGRGRNDYPIELLWRGLLGSIAFKVSSIEEMRRKMGAMPDLFAKVPTSFSFSRFFSNLCRFRLEIEALMVRRAETLHSHFGQVLALGELEGIHFLWEPQFGLPLFFQMAEPDETPSQTAQKLIEGAQSRHPALFQRTQYLLGSHSYTELIPVAGERSKIRCDFIYEEPVLIADPTIATHLYRIAQEAVNNSVKHAKPANILIQLSKLDGVIEMVVEDNGVGLPQPLPKRRGMGLWIINHRAGMIGATLTMQCPPTGGTTITCTLRGQP